MDVKLLIAGMLLVSIVFVASEVQSDVDQDLNRRVNYKIVEIKKTRESIQIMNKLGIRPEIQDILQKFDRNDLPRTRQKMYTLEGMINPSRSEVFSGEVITEGFIRCDFRYPVGTDAYVIRKFTREWAEYVGQIGFECFVYFIGWAGQLKVCGYEYDPIELKVSIFK